LERLGHVGALQVTVSPIGVTITYRDTAAASPRIMTVEATNPYGRVVRDLEQVVRFVEHHGRLGTPEINAAMIRGLLALNPRDTYLDAAAYREMTTGALGGIGLEFSVRQGIVRVLAPIEGTPAARSGLRPRDRIVRIDGVSIESLQAADVVRLLRGRPGTAITLTVTRDGWTEAREVELKRTAFRAPTVIRRELGSGVVYVRLRQLLNETAGELTAVLASSHRAGMRALILDLRDNSGGLLTTAIEVAEQFLQRGRPVTSTESRIQAQNMRFTAQPKTVRFEGPMVALINDATSSGAEIIAAALREWERATLCGERSGGRSEIQTIIPLGDGSALRLTTARWLTGKGRSVDGVGLVPDVEVVADADIETTSGDPAKDNQLRRAIEALTR
jgi:carboxyl-terminal processing protease